MLGLDAARLRQLLAELDEAAGAHESWHQRTSRVIVCRLTPDPRDLTEHSHLGCAFGRWYHQHPPPELLDHPSFVAMAAEHERVHQVAARVLRAAAAGAPVPPQDFDEYVSARERLTLELDSLRHEIHGFLDLATLPRGTDKGCMMKPGNWLLEYARGFIPQAMPMGILASSITTMDYRSVRRQFWEYSKICSREILRGHFF